MKRVLIAGCGYVGSALGRRLAAEGHTVYGLRRNTARLPEGVRPVTADLQEPDSLNKLPDKIDWVVYCAGAEGFTEEAYHKAYIDGPRHLLDALAAQQQTPRRVVFTSSTGVYHQNDGETIDETTEAQPRHFSGAAVLEGEKVFLEHAFPAIILRLSGIYGPERTRMIESVRNGSARRIEGRTAIINHIHRDDCAGAAAHLLQVSNPASLYLGVDDEPADKNEVLTWLAERLQAPLPPIEQVDPDAPPQRGGHRYYSNTRLKGSGYRFGFPTYREGYGSLL